MTSQAKSIIYSPEVEYVFHLKGKLRPNKQGNKYWRRPTKEQIEENKKRNEEAYVRQKSENLKKYGEIYRQFFNRDGPAWYEANTGSVFDETRAYRDIGYLKECIKHGVMWEELQNKRKEEMQQLISAYLETGKVAEDVPLRVIRMHLATPEWADKKKIKEFYKKRDLATKETGVTHHVDHIVPITHQDVCGLHCEFNLQVIEATENIRKRNDFIIS